MIFLLGDFLLRGWVGPALPRIVLHRLVSLASPASDATNTLFVSLCRQAGPIRAQGPLPHPSPWAHTASSSSRSVELCILFSSPDMI